MTRRVSASRILDVTADDAFSIISDVSRLPEWNSAITSVIEQPDPLEIGAQWIVEMRALGQRWQSRSVVETLDPTGRYFAYRSVTDDANPSYVLWTWVVAEHADGALVTVACELHPRTFWRRTLLVHVRARQLGHHELVDSLATLETTTKRPTCAPRGTATAGKQ